MTIADTERYRLHRAARELETWSSTHEFWLPMLLFGSIGAITWAIRGTDGWDGIDGTMVPGLTWALLWYYLCHRKGIDARGIVLWLGMGIALGGELGYGQYVSWIRGMFNAGGEVIPVAPWVGYVWFVLCGIGKGAPGGILLGWALRGKASPGVWLIRIFFMIVLFVVLFNLGTPLLGSGAVDWLGDRFAHRCPWLIFPNSGLGIYAGALDGHIESTVYTNTQNFAMLIWWLAAMLVAALQRDRATLVAGAIIGGGFGIGFVLSALWCLGYVYAPGNVDWWKIWELHAGFNLGLLYVLVLQWATRQVDKGHALNGAPLNTPRGQQWPAAGKEKRTTVFMALGGFVLVFAAGYEYFFWTGLMVGMFYLLAMIFSTWSVDGSAPSIRVNDRRLNVSLAFSAFFLIFRLLQGVTSRAGVILELYEPKAVDQYAWPPARVALFVPLAAILLAATLVAMRRMLKVSGRPHGKRTHLPERMVDLLTFIGFVGATSIWPAKIGVLYAVFLCFAVFALTEAQPPFRRYRHAVSTVKKYRCEPQSHHLPPGARSSRTMQGKSFPSISWWCPPSDSKSCTCCFFCPSSAAGSFTSQ